MKANLYVQGNYWATIQIPGDSLLALLAAGMISHAQHLADELKRDLQHLDQVDCSISLRIRGQPTYIPDSQAGP